MEFTMYITMTMCTQLFFSVANIYACQIHPLFEVRTKCTTSYLELLVQRNKYAACGKNLINITKINFPHQQSFYKYTCCLAPYTIKMYVCHRCPDCSLNSLTYIAWLAFYNKMPSFVRHNSHVPKYLATKRSWKTHFLFLQRVARASRQQRRNYLHH